MGPRVFAAMDKERHRGAYPFSSIDRRHRTVWWSLTAGAASGAQDTVGLVLGDKRHCAGVNHRQRRSSRAIAGCIALCPLWKAIAVQAAWSIQPSFHCVLLPTVLFALTPTDFAAETKCLS